jgi:hypothetical protein
MPKKYMRDEYAQRKEMLVEEESAQTERCLLGAGDGDGSCPSFESPS